MNFWTGEACYVRGVKNGGFGHVSRSSGAHRTFLVLRLIDLTNERASMDDFSAVHAARDIIETSVKIVVK
jgi:hypothetical protein